MNNMKYTIVPPRDVKTIPRYETGLIIHDLQNSDFGEYECHVTNQYGTEYARIHLEKRSKGHRLLVFLKTHFLIS